MPKISAVATPSVFSIISTGISESRKFMSFDISQAYLNADMKDEVLMTLDPAMTKILLEQDKSGQFKDKVSNERVTVKLNKALYGCIQSAKLWYNHLSDYLRTIGFSPILITLSKFYSLISKWARALQSSMINLSTRQ